MKKIVTAVLLSMTIITLSGCSINHLFNEPSQKEMIEIVRSEEVRKLIEKNLLIDDPKAFTEEGVIKNYTIDENQIYWNEGGGIGIVMYLNNNENYERTMLLVKENNKYRISSGTRTPEVMEQIKKRDTNNG